MRSFPARAQHSHSMSPSPYRVSRDSPDYPPERATDPEHPGTVVYHLYISDTMVNYTGKEKMAIAVNGSIPGPVLYFTEGDTAEIYIHNNMRMKTSIHWHGLIVPNRYDGVAYLTTPPIGPGQTYKARFPVVQSGTYWYHSHFMLQEQSQLHGALIIYPRGQRSGPQPVTHEYTLLLSDWTDERPYEVHRSLHNATDWYGIKKGSAQDYAAAIRAGHFGTKLTNEWKRMLSMDVSDVAYDRFLINGRPVLEKADSQPKPGVEGKPQKIRLRIINGGASTYFWLQFAGGKMTVVANDGKDVVPVEVDRMIVAGSETYDVIVTVPPGGSYEWRATSEDRTGSASLWLGSGPRIPALVLPPLNYFEGMKMMNRMMKMNGDMQDMGMRMGHQSMDMNSVMYPELDSKMPGHGMLNNPGATRDSGMMRSVILDYGMLRSPIPTTLPAAPEKILRLNLTGNMNRYIWTIDNRTVSETDKILIHKGENVKIILYNGTMMRHPMHLHGHFFRLLNGQGDYAPLKNVVDILPMETDTLEFAGTESGDWFFHCHILYHMMSGMGRIFHYEGPAHYTAMADHGPASNDTARVPLQDLKKLYADDRMIYPAGKIGLESNGSDGEFLLFDTRYRLQTEWRIGTDARKGYESESHFGRYLGRMQFWFPYAGWDFRYRESNAREKNLFGQEDTKNQRAVACAGIQYLLPMLVVADARVDMKGNLRLQLGREDLPLTARLRLSFMANTDKEYMAGLRYILTKYFALSTHYDSDMGWGGGVTFSY